MSLIDKLQEQEPIPLADDDPQGKLPIQFIKNKTCTHKKKNF